MIIVKIKGGLGNQMFQYAFGRALSMDRNEELFLDISHFNNQAEREAKRDFLLSNFNIRAQILPEGGSIKYTTGIRALFKKIKNKIKKVDAYKFYPVLLRSKSVFYEGHWINQKYFMHHQDSIRNDFLLKNPLSNAAEEISSLIGTCGQRNEVSVSLHIRRGDFVTNPYSAFNGVLGIPYYQEAVNVMNERCREFSLHLFIFSDDIDWAKENLQFRETTTFVSKKEIYDYEEMSLMSKCSNHIIANSTFSWWGAWLNPNKNKIVVSTKQWLKDKTTKELDLVSSEWITI